MKKALCINQEEERSFSLKDFPELTPENFRQYIYKLRNYIELDVRAYPNFYKIKGINFVTHHKKYKNLFYSALGDNVLPIFENLTPQSLVLNSIKLSFNSGKKFYNCLNNVNEKFNESEDPILLENITIDDYDIRIEVFPEITYVDVNNKDKPILHDMVGVIKFTETLGIISGFLHNSVLNIVQIPSVCDWKCVSYRLGRDIQYLYDDPKFHRTWKDMAGGFVKMFCKWEKEESLDNIFDKTHCCHAETNVQQLQNSC